MKSKHRLLAESKPHIRKTTVVGLVVLAVLATSLGLAYNKQAKQAQRTDAACERLGNGTWLADSPRQIRDHRSLVAKVTAAMQDRCPDTIRAARRATADKALQRSIEQQARDRRVAAQAQAEAKETCRRIGALLAEEYTASTLLLNAPENINAASVIARCPADQTEYVRRMNEPETTEVTLRGDNQDGGPLFVTVLVTPADGGTRDVVHSQNEADGWEATLDVESGEEVTLVVEAKEFGDVVECEVGIDNGEDQLDLRDYNTGGIDTFAAECHFQLFTD